MRPERFIFVICLIISLLFSACGEKKVVAETPETRGRRVYFTYCVVCHNADPRKDGSAGPAIAGSSRELLVARVLSQNYPPGYKPKRTTQTMPAYPQVKDRLSDLAAFLKAAGNLSEKARIK
jgi:mono/diheme cytochrome c family protein